MSDLDSLFDEATVVGIDFEDDNNLLVIDHDFRTIEIPSNKKLLGVTSDSRVNILRFIAPRYYNGIDLSLFDFRINYMNANGEGDLYVVQNPVIGDDYIQFNWVVGHHACLYNGDVSFIVCAKLFLEGSDPPVIAREYNTAVHKLPVINGLEVEEIVYEANYDIIDQFLKNINKADQIEEWYQTIVADTELVETYKNQAAESESAAAVSSVLAQSASTEAVGIMNNLKRFLIMSNTVSSMPVEIFDGGEDLVVGKLQIRLDPRQTGSGVPSPTNVRNFIKITSATVSKTNAQDVQTNYTISWDGIVDNVYAGTIDFATGKLTVYPYYDEYTGQTLVGPWISSEGEYTPGRIPPIGSEVVDLGGEPTIHQIVPKPVTTSLDYNYFNTDGDWIDLEYFTKYGNFRLG